MRGGSRLEVSAVDDRPKSQTFTATPAEPGELSISLVCGFERLQRKPPDLAGDTYSSHGGIVSFLHMYHAIANAAKVVIATKSATKLGRYDIMFACLSVELWLTR